MDVIYSAISRRHDMTKICSHFTYLQFVSKKWDSAHENVGGSGSGKCLLCQWLALGRRQPTNPCLDHLQIPHHLIKCATTTNAETIHHLLLKRVLSLTRRPWTVLGSLINNRCYLNNATTSSTGRLLLCAGRRSLSAVWLMAVNSGRLRS